jgi:Mg-chelatase subunit ChlI
MLATERGLLPYSYVVGQGLLKMALELAWISPRIGGVLASGERGTAKSTLVRRLGRLTPARMTKGSYWPTHPAAADLSLGTALT